MYTVYCIYAICTQPPCKKKYKVNHISTFLQCYYLLFLLHSQIQYHKDIPVLLYYGGLFFCFGFCFLFDIPLRNWFMLNVFFSDREIAPLSQHKWNLETRNIWSDYPKVLWLVSMLNILWIPYCTFSFSLLQ